MKFDTVSPIADALESTLVAFRAGDFGRAASQAIKAQDGEDFKDPLPSGSEGRPA